MEYENFSRKELGEILSDFLQSIDFYMPPFSYDFSLEEPIMSYFDSQPWPPAIRKKAVGMAKWMSTGIGMCYPFTDRDSQIKYAIHGIYVLFIEGVLEELGSALDNFAMNLLLGKCQESPVLQSFADFLASGQTYLGCLGNTVNIKSAIEFINGCILERDLDGKITPPTGAVNFPKYLRDKTGFSEPYAHFCFPQKIYPESKYLQTYLPVVPDITEYTCYTNDILSFYKESIVGHERLNYISNYANTQGVGLADALREVCANVTRNVHNVRSVLANHPEMLKNVEEYFRGYAAWYLNQKRYRLDDIQIRGADDQRYELTPTQPDGLSRE
ncbi:hypothetical protein EYZ11_007032 [Aspergillus tanneri]|nr:hypothetical protein EYZ11_007032 [Aspergillus tanneri]